MIMQKLKLTVLLAILVHCLGMLYLNSQTSESVIAMDSNTYEKLVQTHPDIQLDRLYRKKRMLYFLVGLTEYQKLIQLDIPFSPIRSIPPPKKVVQKSGNFDYNGIYHSYAECNAMLMELQETYPQQASVFSIGQSVEERELNIIHITDHTQPNINKRNIFIVGCHHAREWISVEIPLLFAEYLLKNREHPEIKRALVHLNIYILPIANPDGLEFSIHHYRYWRKNRTYNGNFLWGIDLNRNYGYMWGYDDIGSSPDPASGVYRGSAPFSEPESDNIRRFLLNHPPDGSISYHNYSQLILIPWGYTLKRPDDYPEMARMAAEMSDRIFSVNGRRYAYGGSEALYLVNGGTDDWIYGTFGIPSFTIELPPTSSIEGGFYTSEAEIQLAFNENLPALLYFIQYFIDGESAQLQLTGQDQIQDKPGPRKCPIP